MAIVINNVSTQTTSTSHSYTVSAGNRRLLLVIGIGTGSGTATPGAHSVSYAGTAMKSLTWQYARQVNPNYWPNRAEVFYMVDPPTGSNTVSVTVGAGHSAFSHVTLDLQNFYGFRAATTTTSGITVSSPQTVGTSVTSDNTIPDLVMSALFKPYNTTSYSEGAGQTMIYDNSSGNNVVSISTKTGDLTSTSYSYTISSAANENGNATIAFALVPNPTATAISVGNVSSYLSGGTFGSGSVLTITGTTPNRSLLLVMNHTPGTTPTVTVGSQVAKILSYASSSGVAQTIQEVRNPSAGNQTISYAGAVGTSLYVLAEKTGGAHVLANVSSTSGSGSYGSTWTVPMDNTQAYDPGAGALSALVLTSSGGTAPANPVGAMTVIAGTFFATHYYSLTGWSGASVSGGFTGTLGGTMTGESVCFHGAPLIYSEDSFVFGTPRYQQEALVVRDFLTDIYLTTQVAINDPDKADAILISESVTVTRPDPYSDITGVADKLKISEKIYIGLDPALINIHDTLIIDEPYRELYLDPLDYGSTREPKSAVAITEDTSVKLYPMVWGDRSVPSISWFGGSRPVPDSFPYYPLPSIAPVTSPPISVPSSDPYTGSASTFTSPATYRVHPVYVYPSDASYSPDYFSAITSAMQNVQLWLYDELGIGNTFSLVTVNSVQSSHPAAYYASTANGNDSTLYYWNNAKDELLALVGASFWDVYDKWIFFLDAPASGQKTGSAYAVSLLHQAFIDGIRGVDTGYQGMPAYEANKWIGEITHEVLHTLGLLHPAVQTTTSVMSAGYVLYPNCSIDTGTVYCEDDRYLNFVTELTNSPFMNATAI